MEKNYSETKKRYNSNNTFIQIDKTIHKELKDYCKTNNLSIKNFIEKIITENLKNQQFFVYLLYEKTYKTSNRIVPKISVIDRINFILKEIYDK